MATDQEVLQAFRLLAETEGILPALEAAHALAWLAREAGREVPLGSTVLVTLSGRGDKDVAQVRELLGDGPPPEASSKAGRPGSWRRSFGHGDEHAGARLSSPT